MLERHDLSSSSERRENMYPFHVLTAIELTKYASGKNVGFVIVGGTAFDFHIYENNIRLAPSLCSRGLVRDVDIIFTDPDMNPNLGDDLIADFRDRFYQKFGFSPTKIEPARSDLSRFIQWNRGLVYKQLFVALPSEAFRPILFFEDDTSIPVINLVLLYFHLRLFSGRYDREKDVKKGVAIRERLIKANLLESELYIELEKRFNFFWHHLNRRYPISMNRRRKWQERKNRGIDDSLRPHRGFRNAVMKVVYGAENMLATKGIQNPYNQESI